MNNQKENKTMVLRNIHHSRILIICGTLLIMAVLCGMSEARVGGDILNTLPHSLGTLQGSAVLDQLHL